MKHTSFSWRWVALGVLSLLTIITPVLPLFQQTASANGEQFAYSATTKSVSGNGGLITVPGPMAWKFDSFTPGSSYFYGVLSLDGAQTRFLTGSTCPPGTTGNGSVSCQTVCVDTAGKPVAKCIHPPNPAPCQYGVGLYPNPNQINTDGSVKPGLNSITIGSVDFDNGAAAVDGGGSTSFCMPGDSAGLAPTPQGTAMDLFIKGPFTIPVIAGPIVTCTAPYVLFISDNSCRAPVNADGTCPNGGKPINGVGGKKGYCQQDGTVLPPGTNNDTTPPDPCPIEATALLRWMACPVFLLANKFTGLLDGFINDYLDSGNNIIGANNASFHKGWATFRSFGIGLVVIAGIVMVMSEALGLGLVDAYTVRKIAPRLFIAIIGIAVSWSLMLYTIGLFDNLGHAMGNIIYNSFSVKPTDVSIGALFAADTAAGLAFIGKLVLLGPFGILSAIGTILFGMLIAIVVLIARQAIIVLCVILAPLAIASYVLPNTSKLAKFWWDTFIRMLALYPIATGIIALCKVMGNLTIGLGNTFSALAGVLFYFAGYAILPFAFRLAGGAVATLGGIYNDRTKGVFDRGKKTRAGIQGNRVQNLKEGSMWRDNRLSRPINAIGRSVGAAQAGAGIHGFLGTARGRSARALYDGSVREARMKRNPLLAESQNNDDANNVLGFSGGSEQGLQEAARDIFRRSDGSYDENRAERAMAGARAVGVNRGNAAAAYQSSMANKARAVAPGNVRALDRAVRRLARNDEEYDAIAQAGAAAARGSGRHDLGGTSWISAGRDNATWREAAASAGAVAAANPGMTREMAEYQIIADRTMVNGINRSGVHAIMTGPGNQARQTMDALSRQLQTAPVGSRERVQAAMTLKEFQGGLPGATPEVRDIVNEVLYSPAGTGTNGTGLGLNVAEVSHPTAPRSIAQQLADLTGTGMSGTTLTTLARTYAEQTDPGRIGAPGAGGGGPGGGGTP